MAIAFFSSSGCVIAERKTLVLVIPEKSKKVEMFYVFEGISASEKTTGPFSNGTDVTLMNAQTSLNDLKKDPLGFFAQPGLSALIFGWNYQRNCFKSDLVFYLNPTRERRLCAYREVTILDRNKWIDEASDSPIIKQFGDNFSNQAKTRTAETLRESLADISERLQEKESKDLVEKNLSAFGVVAFTPAILGLARLAAGLDVASVELVREAAQKNFPWIRIEDARIEIRIPATKECAKKIVADPKSAKLVDELKSFVTPLSFEAVEEGLCLVIGKKGHAIRLSYADSRPYQKKLEADLIWHAGSPEPLSINGMQANADRLVERFLANVTK